MEEKREEEERKIRVDCKDCKGEGRQIGGESQGEAAPRLKTSEQILHENEEGREEGRTAEQNRTEQSKQNRTGHSIK